MAVILRDTSKALKQNHRSTTTGKPSEQIFSLLFFVSTGISTGQISITTICCFQVLLFKCYSWAILNFPQLPAACWDGCDHLVLRLGTQTPKTNQPQQFAKVVTKHCFEQPAISSPRSDTTHAGKALTPQQAIMWRSPSHPHLEQSATGVLHLLLHSPRVCSAHCQPRGGSWIAKAWCDEL